VPADRKTQRDNARDALLSRTRGQKKVGAFKSRIEEAEVLAQILVRKHRLTSSQARMLAFRASPIQQMLSKRGQPPRAHELYEGVEFIRDANKGKLPTEGRAPFWEPFLRQWNAFHREERPELMYPDWRTMQSVYRSTKRRLESAARAAMGSAEPDRD
jgi:hypothetical protein